MIKQFWLGIIMVIGVNACAWEWQIGTLDTHKWSGTSVAGALDLLGNPCFVYTRNKSYTQVGKGLIYIRWNPADTSWIYEFVGDSIGVVDASESSLKFDSNGYPRVSFWQAGFSLTYAWKDSLGWHMLNGGGAGASNSLALDTSDFPHIAANGNFGWDSAWVAHIWYDGTQWTTEIVEVTRGASSLQLSICVDKGDTVHLAYGGIRDSQGYGIPGFGYAKRPVNGSAGWAKEYVDTSLATGGGVSNLSMALNSFGHPCIAYRAELIQSSYPNELRYAEKTDSGWCVTRVDTTTGGGYNNQSSRPTIAIDKKDNPHIVYRNEPSSSADTLRLKYAWRYNGEWYFDIVDPTANLSSVWTSGSYGLIIDTSGYSHIGYGGEVGGPNGSKMKYAKGRADTLGVKILPKQFKTGLHLFPSIGNKRIKIIYSIEEEGKVTISIYDTCGRKISELLSAQRIPGEYITYWEPTDISSGVYFCLFMENNKKLAKKFIVVK